MTGRRVYVWSGSLVVIFAGLLAAPAWSGHGHNESMPNYSSGCGAREAVSQIRGLPSPARMLGAY